MVKRILLVAVAVLVSLSYFTSVQAAGVIVNTYDYKEGKIDIEYPYFDGMTNKAVQDSMNALMQQKVNQFIDENQNEITTQARMRYKVHLNKDNKLSLSVLTYVYAGGAHGSSRLQGYTVDLSSGKEYQFADLFRFDQSSRNKINQLIARQIRQKNISIFEPFRGISDHPTFYLEEDNKVVVVFQQYEIAPYSSGILKFPLSY